MEIIVKGADFSANSIGKVQRVIHTATFNGTSSEATFTSFTLSSSGDYVEFLLAVESTAVTGYFACRQTWNKPVIGIAKTAFSLRMDNDTWAVSNQPISPSDVSNVKVKISFEGTDVKVYIDDVSTFTFDNSANSTLTLVGFGKYLTSGDPNWWKGTIKKLRSNKLAGGEWIGADELAGWAATNVVIS